MPTLFSITGSDIKLRLKPIQLTCYLDIHVSALIGFMQGLDYLNTRVTVKEDRWHSPRVLKILTQKFCLLRT